MLPLPIGNKTGIRPWRQRRKKARVTIYGQPRAGVGKAILAFKDAYPKIKLNFVGGSGSALAKKIMAEKRADKHLVDLSIGGGGTMVLVYHKAGLLQPIPPQLILPEVVDQTKWWSKKHLYSDPEGQHVFMRRGMPAPVSARSIRISSSLAKSIRGGTFWRPNIEARSS